MNASIVQHNLKSGRSGVLPMPLKMPQVCAVHLIDRHTGSGQRTNGSPRVISTCQPFEAATELPAGHVATIWRVRVDQIERGERQ